MLTLSYRFARGREMKMASTCMALITVSSLVAGCQRLKSPGPVQAPAAVAEKAPESSREPARCTAMAGLAQSVRRRHFNLP